MVGVGGAASQFTKYHSDIELLNVFVPKNDASSDDASRCKFSLLKYWIQKEEKYFQVENVIVVIGGYLCTLDRDTIKHFGTVASLSV